MIQSSFASSERPEIDFCNSHLIAASDQYRHKPAHHDNSATIPQPSLNGLPIFIVWYPHLWILSFTSISFCKKRYNIRSRNDMITPRHKNLNLDTNPLYFKSSDLIPSEPHCLYIFPFKRCFLVLHTLQNQRFIFQFTIFVYPLHHYILLYLLLRSFLPQSRDSGWLVYNLVTWNMQVFQEMNFKLRHMFHNK